MPIIPKNKEDWIIRNSSLIFEDIFESIDRIKDKKHTYTKSELALLFVLIDALSRIYVYLTGQKELDEPKNNKKRFKLWVDKFLFDDKNKTYKEYKKEINCDSEVLYALRNSIIHFYGFPSKVNGEKVGLDITHNIWPEEMLNWIREMFVKEKDKLGKRYIIIDGFYIFEAMYEAYKLYAENISIFKKDNLEQYLKGVEDCFEIINDEQTIPIKDNLDEGWKQVLKESSIYKLRKKIMDDN